MKGILRSEAGIALPIVMALVVIISLLGFTAAFVVESQSVMGQRFAGGEDALYYAEAGYNKYLWHLNEDSRFYETAESDALLNVDTPFQDGFYRLQIQKPTTDEPVVTITSTGWPANDPTNRRTIEVKVHKRQFVQQVYLSNNDGSDIWWTSGEECRGPLHTNGTLRIQRRPVFYGPVTYSQALVKGTGYNPDYREGPPQKVDPLVFPANNLDLKTWAEKDKYLYYGRTCIYLDNDQLVIRDRNGNLQTRPLPPNGVLYVDGDGTSKWGSNTGNVFVSGTLSGRLTIAAKNDIYITYDDPTDWSEPPWFAPATGGIRYANTTFIHHVVDGKLVTEVQGDDMLGLVANRCIYILHYGWPKEGQNAYWDYRLLWLIPYDVAPHKITIHAAIFAINNGFGYEEYDSGPAKGDIKLIGSIIQQTRLPVGEIGGSGYDKDYTHDPRMRYDYPPHFLEPQNAGWEAVNWREIANP
ncbi:MAG: hypothetical protein QMC81_07915 [Thermoanaerobacterales bacterium]|nr:hypothetical protein [Thermoanaerobacterales bacterium]